VLILRCRDGEVLASKVWGKVADRRFGSGVLPARGPWWLKSKTELEN